MWSSLLLHRRVLPSGRARFWNVSAHRLDDQHKHVRLLGGFPSATCYSSKISSCPAHKQSADSSENTDERKLKPFDEIPGPKPLPLVGNLFRYMTGEYSFDQLYETGLKKYNQFGSIVREEILPGVNLVLLYLPEDIERMYQLEGKYPSRRSHAALEFYRLSKPEIYGSGGLLPTNGPEWHRLRMSLQRPINKTGSIRRYIPDVNQVADEFTESVAKSISTNEASEDFLHDLSRVFLEFIGLVTFDKRLGSLDEDLARNSCPMKLIEATYTINSLILKTDNGLQLWRNKWNIKTPLYKKLTNAQEYLEKVALQYVKDKKEEMQQRIPPKKQEETLLEVYLSSDDLSLKDVTTMVSDMLLAGIDTSSFTMSFVLYHLANSPSKQEKLYAELENLLPHNYSPVNEDVLAQLKYLKAVVKESFRLNPISIGVGRILPENGSFSGYFCPKNTILVTQNQVSCRLERFFREPHQFLPERWMKGHPAYEKTHPYLVLPFGHGPRACIARRLAEQNLYILLAKLIRRFRIEWHGETLNWKSHLINKPDGPLKIRFKER